MQPESAAGECINSIAFELHANDFYKRNDKLSKANAELVELGSNPGGVLFRLPANAPPKSGTVACTPGNRCSMHGNRLRRLK